MREGGGGVGSGLRDQVLLSTGVSYLLLKVCSFILLTETINI